MNYFRNCLYWNITLQLVRKLEFKLFWNSEEQFQIKQRENTTLVGCVKFLNFCIDLLVYRSYIFKYFWVQYKIILFFQPWFTNVHNIVLSFVLWKWKLNRILMVKYSNIIIVFLIQIIKRFRTSNSIQLYFQI